MRRAASCVSRATGGAHLGEIGYRPLYPLLDPLQSLPREEKIALLHRVDKVARAADARVQEVNASITGAYEQVLVAATDGTLAADVRPLVRLSVSVLVEQDGKRERGSSGGGGRFGYDYFPETVDGDVRADAYAKEAVRMALVNLGAVAAPAGNMPVVLGAGWPGVLLHEAVGHGPKATSIGVAPRCSAAIWASWWLPSCAPWWMTAPCKGGAVRWRSTTKAYRASTTC